MPTTRRPIRRTPQEDADLLFPELIDVLLEGWSCPLRQTPLSDAFRIFSYTEADLDRIWRRHRDWLLDEAQRRGLARPVAAEKWFETNRPAWLGSWPVNGETIQ
jgi:hypothetical protein